MKNYLLTASLVFLTAAPALAQTTDSNNPKNPNRHHTRPPYSGPTTRHHSHPPANLSAKARTPSARFTPLSDHVVAH